MSLDFKFPADQTNLLSLDGVVYKVKLTYEKESAAKNEALTLGTCLEVVKSELEEALRAIFLMFVGDKRIRPVKTRHFRFHSIRKPWRAARKLKFRCRGSELQTYHDYLDINVWTKLNPSPAYRDNVSCTQKLSDASANDPQKPLASPKQLSENQSASLQSVSLQKPTVSSPVVLGARVSTRLVESPKCDSESSLKRQASPTENEDQSTTSSPKRRKSPRKKSKYSPRKKGRSPTRRRTGSPSRRGSPTRRRSASRKCPRKRRNYFNVNFSNSNEDSRPKIASYPNTRSRIANDIDEHYMDFQEEMTIENGPAQRSPRSRNNVTLNCNQHNPTNIGLGSVESPRKVVPQGKQIAPPICSPEVKQKKGKRPLLCKVRLDQFVVQEEELAEERKLQQLAQPTRSPNRQPSPRVKPNTKARTSLGSALELILTPFKMFRSSKNN